MTSVRFLCALMVALCFSVFAASAYAAETPVDPYDEQSIWEDPDNWKDEDDAWDPNDERWQEEQKKAMREQKLRGVKYRKLILHFARIRKLEPGLVAAVIHQESAFNPRARSYVGARGLMQLMPATARGLGGRVDRLYDPKENIRLGTLYLAQLRRMFGNKITWIAAGYNAGPGAVRKFGGVPPYGETQHYVKRIVALRALYRRK